MKLLISSSNIRCEFVSYNFDKIVFVLIKTTSFFFFFFFNCYVAGPQQTLGHSQGDCLTNLILITAFYLCRPGIDMDMLKKSRPLWHCKNWKTTNFCFIWKLSLIWRFFLPRSILSHVTDTLCNIFSQNLI